MHAEGAEHLRRLPLETVGSRYLQITLFQVEKVLNGGDTKKSAVARLHLNIDRVPALRPPPSRVCIRST